MKSKPATAKSFPDKVTNGNLFIFGSICIILALIVFSPVFTADFVNWDDDYYVIKNTTIQSAGNLGKILKEPVQGNFHPATMLSLAIDYWISDGKPQWFHAVNVFLHLVNIVLVFFFFYLFAGKKIWIAAVTALLFAIHPLHVESVAWISERKDLLYSAFFLGGLLLYLKYLKKNSLAVLSGVFILFLFSLLSKPAAVVFPLALLAIDFYFNRLKQRRTYMEKIPFFVLSLVFGIITLQVQKAYGAYSDEGIYPLSSRFFFGNYGIMMYLVKTVFPFRLCAFYPFPAVNVNLPFVYYLSFPFTLALIMLFAFSVKRYKEIAFALLFYGINLILVLQFFAVGNAVIADRYTYIPLLGPFFLAGFYVQRYMDGKKGRIPLVFGILLAVVVLSLVIISRKQASSWKDGGTLWDQAIKVAPSSKAYANRGVIHKKEGDTRKALEMFSQAVSMDDNQTDALVNRANIYYSQQKYMSAIADYSRCIAVEPDNEKAYANRGAAYLAIGLTDSALIDLNRAIELDPESRNGYKNRGMLYLMTNRYPEAISNYTKHLSIVPDEDGETWNKIGYAFHQLGDYPKAIEAFSRAIRIAGKGNFYYLRALSYFHSGDIARARSDMEKALSKGVPADPELLRSLGFTASGQEQGTGK
jgi:tetratricopeptide (TPR) repeat protein